MIAVLLLIAAHTIWISHADAQAMRTARLELTDNQKRHYIGPDSYMRQDPTQSITYDVIVSRHENNLRGQRLTTERINLGMDNHPTWILLSVVNNTNTEDWVLQFGGLFDGRTAMVRKLEIRSHTTGKIITRAMREEGQQGAFGEDLQAAAIPIKIQKNQPELLVIYLETAGIFPHVIRPHLMTEHDYVSEIRRIGLQSGFFSIFFLVMTGFFLAIAFLYKNWVYALFSLYYILQGGLMLALESTFFLRFLFLADLIAILFCAVFIVTLAITKFFLRVRNEDHGANMTIFVIGALITASALFNMILPASLSTVTHALIFIPTALSLPVLAVIAHQQAQSGKFSGHYLSAAWLTGFVGLLGPALVCIGWLPPAALTQNLYWYLLPLQAVFLVSGTRTRISMIEQQRRHAEARENRAAQSLARLQKSKESADQARLLRVIERERELMTELREREMQRTEEMRRAKDMADQANRAKSAFLAVVSHEIRTPMTGIMGIVKLLNDTKMTKEQSDYIMAIQKSGDTMMALLNDILDFEKIESGNMDLEEIDFDLPRLIQGVVTLMSGHAMDKGLQLKADIASDVPRFVMGDPTRLRQVLLNLVNNAIKFTDLGDVTIRIKAKRLIEKPPSIQEDFEVYFAVQDTGIGISEQAQRSLFMPFEQTNKSVTRKYGGTGLGLAICKKLINAMGSSMHVDSREGEGSTFFFTILMKEGSSEKAESIDDIRLHSSYEAVPEMRVMVIEDNEINRKVLNQFLIKDGHKITLCESGEAALEILQAQSFDLIFTDINLNGMSGLDTARIIRTSPDRGLAQTPIIAITGNTQDEEIEAIYQAGINDYIFKPIDYNQLLQKLADVYHKRLTAYTRQTGKDMPPAYKEPVEAALPDDKADDTPASDAETEDREPQAPVASLRFADEEPEDEDLAAADSNVPPLQAFLKQMEKPNAEEDGSVDNDDEFDSFAEAGLRKVDTSSLSFADDADKPAQVAENAAEKTGKPTIQILNEAMVKGLFDSLGAEQTRELMDSYMQKADEIVAQIAEDIVQNNVSGLLERAHELKGMAANFGIAEVADIAGRVEKLSRQAQGTDAIAAAKTLSDANFRAKGAIVSWLQQQDNGNAT